MKFSQEQLEFIAKHFKRVGDVIAIRDGIVEKDDWVWWREEYGPQHIRATDTNHWENMQRAWEYYQVDEPKVQQFMYLD